MKNKDFLLLTFALLISGLLQAQSPKLPGDTISLIPVHFDDTTNFHMITIDTSSCNIWQIGTPSKSLFSQAYSLPFSMMTDTANIYSSGVHSWFEVNVGQWQGRRWISFMHKYDTDTLKDGGYITISWDNGISWRNILHDTIWGAGTPGYGDWFNFCKNIYSPSDSLSNNQPGFSGSSNGWVHTVLAWYYIPVKQNPGDSILLRFNFVSDSIGNNREGWMIDNFNIYEIELMGGIGETDIQSCVGLFPNPMNQSATLHLDKCYQHVQIDVYSTEGRLVESRSYSNTEQVNFERGNLTRGLYFLKVHMDRLYQENLKLLIR